MGNTIDWGQAAVNNTIGFGDGAENNTIGWGDIQADSWSPETNLTGTGGTPAWSNTLSTNFDGVDDYVDLGGSTGLDFSGSFTLMAWIKTDAIGANQFIIDTSTSGSSGNGYSVRINTDGKIKFWSYAVGGLVNGTTVLSVSTWYHVACVHDTSAGTNKIYLNGVLENTSSYTFPTASNTTNLWIGKSNLFASTFDGLIDEVGFFGTDESANINSIYNAGTPTDLSTYSPTSYYRMGDNDTYPTITDNVGSNDGTMNNMTSANFVTDVPT